MAINYPKILVDIPKRAPMFSLEGIDGSGKSTQAQKIKKRLKSIGVKTVMVSSPTKGPIGRFLRKNLKTIEPWQKSTLFLLEMIYSLTKIDISSVLIWDRYIDSDIVSNEDIDPEIAEKWIHPLPKPKRTFFLNITPDKIIKNRQSSLHDHSINKNWQKLKYERYCDLIIKDPNRFINIDATKSVGKITDEILEIILKDLNIKA